MGKQVQQTRNSKTQTNTQPTMETRTKLSLHNSKKAVTHFKKISGHYFKQTCKRIETMFFPHGKILYNLLVSGLHFHCTKQFKAIYSEENSIENWTIFSYPHQNPTFCRDKKSCHLVAAAHCFSLGAPHPKTLR